MNSIVALILLIAVPFSYASIQRIVATGTLMCGDVPYTNATIKLVDIDVGSDDEMDKKKTDKSGTFTVDGKTDEATNIDPVLKIYHYCNNGAHLCPRRWKITIPKSYIIQATETKVKTFRFGSVNLESELEKEDHDCFH